MIKEEDFLKEAEEVSTEDLEDHETRNNTKPHKIIASVGGVVLLLLMLSYVFVTYPVNAIIEGKLESKVLSENMLFFGEFSVEFDEKVYSDLRDMYFEEMEVEFSVCLLGEKDGKEYKIDDLYQPKMYSQTFNRVEFEGCSAETIMILHTHPYKKCVASQTDIDLLEKSKKVNSDVLMVVMCEPDRFAVYS